MRGLGLPLRRIVLSLVVAAASLAGASSLAWADPDCQVIALRGSATLERDGAPSALTNGAELGTGDWIATDADARVKLRFADGSTVQLGENSRLRIDLAKFDQAQGKRNILLDLPLGLLRAAAAKLTWTSGSSFEIHTGIGYSAVRGTQWIMEAASEETRVYVQEGRVSVGPDFPSTQFPKLVEAGYWVIVRKAGIETIEAAPPEQVDRLMEQTEAALSDGVPADDAATEETAETETNAVSNATGAVNGVPDSVVDPDSSAGSAATSGTVSGAATSADGDAASAANSSSGSSSGSNDSPNNSPDNSPNGSSNSSSNGGSSNTGSSSSGGNGGSSSGGSSKAGGGGSLSGGSNKGSNKSGLGGSNKLK